MPAARNHSRSWPSRRTAFTLTELLIAIAVLVGVLLAVSKIFSTTTAVTARPTRNHFHAFIARSLPTARPSR